MPFLKDGIGDFLFYRLWPFLCQTLSVGTETSLWGLPYQCLEVSLLEIYASRNIYIKLLSTHFVPYLQGTPHLKGRPLWGEKDSDPELLIGSIPLSTGVYSPALPFLFNDYSNVQLFIFRPLHTIFFNPLYIDFLNIFFTFASLSSNSCS